MDLLKEQKESEDDYASRALPVVPPSALLTQLSVLWEYPKGGDADILGAIERVQDAPELAGYAGDFASLREAFAAYAASRETVVGASMVQLDHTRLFIGSFKMYAPPYASYYTDGADQIFGPTAVAVEEVYAQFGLELDSGEHDMPDHIRYLLAFLAMLAEGFETMGSRDAALAFEDFVAEFVRPWLPAFREKIHTYTEYPFFKRLIDLTGGYLGVWALADVAGADAAGDLPASGEERGR